MCFLLQQTGSARMRWPNCRKCKHKTDALKLYSCILRYSLWSPPTHPFPYIAHSLAFYATIVMLGKTKTLNHFIKVTLNKVFRQKRAIFFTVQRNKVGPGNRMLDFRRPESRRNPYSSDPTEYGPFDANQSGHGFHYWNWIVHFKFRNKCE